MKPHPLPLALAATLALANLHADDPAITLYNDGFGVVREQITLDLKSGENPFSFSDVTAALEPQSVVLRDLSGKNRVTILEQSYRADPISQGLLLRHFEGQEITFRRQVGDTVDFPKGRIVRSGYEVSEPVIEINGQIQFGLPGQPLFPQLPGDSILKPTLDWVLHSKSRAKIDAEIGYVTGGLSWSADYNVIAREDSDKVEVVGWITMGNHTGRSFADAKIKLIAGDVNKIHQPDYDARYGRAAANAVFELSAKQVEEKSFEDFHMYTLARPTTLLDRQTKQVEFMRAANVTAKPIYVYDGAADFIGQTRHWDPRSLRQEQAFGAESNAKVWIIREIPNTEANGLGLALPKGKIRFYKQDSDGQLEFTGENLLDHTPKKETLRLATGNAFDVVGERKRTHYQLDQHRYLEEAFAITLKNRKDTPVTVRVVEHLYRWSNWQITEKSQDFQPVDSDTVAFQVELPPDSEKTLTYKARYTW